MGRVLPAAAATRAVRLIAVAVLAIVLTACEERRPGSDESQVSRGVRAIEGIPQDGAVLGRPEARWSLTVIAAATSFELDQLITLLPAVADDYVRPGRLKLRLVMPASGGYDVDGDERAAAGALLAAGSQDHLWDAVVRFVPTYHGSLQDAKLSGLLQRSGVRQVRRALQRRSGAGIERMIADADAEAVAAGGKGGVLYLLAHGEAKPKDVSVDVALGRLSEALATEIG